MTVAVFDPVAWGERYPELAVRVGAGLATLYFNEACTHLDNSDASPVADPVLRLTILNAVTAHIAALNAPTADGEPSPELVGRITSGSMGSVSVSAEMAPATAGSAWWMQTKYGAAAWQMLAPYRTFRYVAGRQPVFDRPGWGWGGPWR